MQNWVITGGVGIDIYITYFILTSNLKGRIVITFHGGSNRDSMAETLSLITCKYVAGLGCPRDTFDFKNLVPSIVPHGSPSMVGLSGCVWTVPALLGRRTLSPTSEDRHNKWIKLATAVKIVKWLEWLKTLIQEHALSGVWKKVGGNGWTTCSNLPSFLAQMW